MDSGTSLDGEVRGVHDSGRKSIVEERQLIEPGFIRLQQALNFKARNVLVIICAGISDVFSMIGMQKHRQCIDAHVNEMLLMTNDHHVTEGL